jgi:hypothetical protein
VQPPDQWFKRRRSSRKRARSPAPLFGELDSDALALIRITNDALDPRFALGQSEPHLDFRADGTGRAVGMKTPPALKSRTRDTLGGPLAFHATPTPFDTETRARFAGSREMPGASS